MKQMTDKTEAERLVIEYAKAWDAYVEADAESSDASEIMKLFDAASDADMKVVKLGRRLMKEQGNE